MAKVRTSSSATTQQRRRQAISPDSREEQMISYAMNLVEQRLLDGTASSQEVVHFLKLGTRKHQREIEKLEEENKLLRAKTEALESGKEYNVLVEKAIKFDDPPNLECHKTRVLIFTY